MATPHSIKNSSHALGCDGDTAGQDVVLARNCQGGAEELPEQQQRFPGVSGVRNEGWKFRETVEFSCRSGTGLEDVKAQPFCRRGEEKQFNVQYKGLNNKELQVHDLLTLSCLLAVLHNQRCCPCCWELLLLEQAAGNKQPQVHHIPLSPHRVGNVIFPPLTTQSGKCDFFFFFSPPAIPGSR